MNGFISYNNDGYNNKVNDKDNSNSDANKICQ
jgi:hypothetical protein